MVIHSFIAGRSNQNLKQLAHCTQSGNSNNRELGQVREPQRHIISDQFLQAKSAYPKSSMIIPIAAPTGKNDSNP